MLQGTVPELEGLSPANTYPQDHPFLHSPYGRIWFEWPEDISDIPWETAVEREMVILTSLVFSGWIRAGGYNMPLNRRVSGESSFPLASGDRRHLSLDLSPYRTEHSQAPTESSFRDDDAMTPSRRASESAGTGKQVRFNDYSGPWDRKLLLDPPSRATPAYRGHRNTLSSPGCLPSPTTNPWGNMSFD